MRYDVQCMMIGIDTEARKSMFAVECYFYSTSHNVIVYNMIYNDIIHNNMI